LESLGQLLRAEPLQLRDWTERGSASSYGLQVLTILAGAGLYGAALGIWRAPLQAAYVAIKLPLILLLTMLGNALLNAMLAPLLGLNISLRQTLAAVLASFAIAASILGALSPLLGFLVWNAPPLAETLRTSASTHSLILLANVIAIALAGIVSNVRLLGLLRELSGQARIARRVLFAWLGVNLFLGSQLSWILRPFIGSPVLPVEFLRGNALEGNFYETVFRALVRLLNLNLQ